MSYHTPSTEIETTRTNLLNSQLEDNTINILPSVHQLINGHVLPLEGDEDLKTSNTLQTLNSTSEPWLISPHRKEVFQLRQRDFFDCFDENVIAFRDLENDAKAVHKGTEASDMALTTLDARDASVLNQPGVNYWVAHLGKPLGPMSVQALGDMMQGPKNCPVISAAVNSSHDPPPSSDTWCLLESEEGEQLRRIGKDVFGMNEDPSMAHIEVCLVFVSPGTGDRFLLRFTASLHAPPFKDPTNPRYDELRIECRTLRSLNAFTK